MKTDKSVAATLLAIDQGTTSSRAILFSAAGNVLAMRQKELVQHYPQKGRVEHDALDIWHDSLWACRAVIDDAPEEARHLLAIGISNQRETTIVWDRATGLPISNAIVWQDRRTADRCEALRGQGREDMIRRKTGLLLDPYFSASKLEWILDNVEGARHRAEQGELAFGTVDSWLLWKLTGGAEHATDATNAARTMLFNIHTRQWDDELLALFNIPPALLPTVKDNAADFGLARADLIGRSVPVSGMAGDQHAALVGQACFAEGMLKSTYGTGCFAMMNIGAEPRESRNRLLTTPAYQLNGKMTYAIEGSIFVAGAAIQWLRDNLRLFFNAAESEALAASVPDSNGVYFVPAFTGLGAPYWAPHARASITGLTRESNAAHITRAALEAQAYQTLDRLKAMAADIGEFPAVMRADGGLTANRLVCQLIADMIDRPLELPEVTETTAWGAACLAGLQVGVFHDLDEISACWHAAQSYGPNMPAADREQMYAGWQAAVSRVVEAG